MLIAAQPDYADVQRVIPLERAAEALHRTVGERGMDVIALGPGTGHLETRLVGLVAAKLQHPAIRFYLLDISQPLLAEAYRQAADDERGDGLQGGAGEGCELSRLAHVRSVSYFADKVQYVN